MYSVYLLYDTPYSGSCPGDRCVSALLELAFQGKCVCVRNNAAEKEARDSRGG